MHIQKVILVPLSLLGMAATFMPWLINPGVAPTYGTTGAGWITFGIYFLILVVILTGNFKSGLSGFSFTCISILSILCAVYGLILTDQQSTAGVNNLTQNPTSAGLGLYILIIAGFLIPIAGFFTRRKGIMVNPRDPADD